MILLFLTKKYDTAFGDTILLCLCLACHRELLHINIDEKLK
uniref:Uncharacterized protein n=1 Tax=Arundo donax TaxID=35708 RepID=A0A0A9FC47_ARUDO